MSATILIVEDDSSIVALIREACSGEDYVFAQASTCEEGWKYFETFRPTLVILDVGLPGDSGLTLCRRIRSHPTLATTPVIVLTGHTHLEDKVEGFSAGADHYLTKPIPIQELQLWIAALLRRINYLEMEGGILRANDFVIDPKKHTVTASGQIVGNLTRKEFELLYELVRRHPKVLSKESLLSHLWHATLRDNTVEVHIKNLRSKLGAASRRIVTVSGVGYRFD